MILYWSRELKPLDTLEWAHLFEDDSYRQVALTDVGRFRISTVWHGLNQGGSILLMDMPGEIFESAVLGSTEHFNTDNPVRYYTEAQAVEGHWILVRLALLGSELFGEPRKQLTTGRGQ